MLPLPQLLAELVRRPSVNPMGRSDLPPDMLHESHVTAFLEGHLRDIGCEFHRQSVVPGCDNLIATYTHPAPHRPTSCPGHTMSPSCEAGGRTHIGREYSPQF